MPRYSIAEAQERLAAIVDQALAGEHVMIILDGVSAVELRPAPGREATGVDLLDIIAERSRGLPPLGESPAVIVREMRDEIP